MLPRFEQRMRPSTVTNHGLSIGFGPFRGTMVGSDISSRFFGDKDELLLPKPRHVANNLGLKRIALD
jgi:hypothetical protein